MTKKPDINQNRYGQEGMGEQVMDYQKSACGQSPYKPQIDAWLNEGKSFSFISKELKKLGDPISDKAIGRYARGRQESAHKMLVANNPTYKHEVKKVNQEIADSVSQFKVINTLNHLAEAIEGNAKLMAEGMDAVVVENAQDLRYVTQNMLDAIKLHAELTMQAQKFAKIEEDPSLLRPTQSQEVKSVIINMFGEMDDDAKYKMADLLRAGLGSGK